MAISVNAHAIASTAASRSPVADLSSTAYSSAVDDIIVMGVRVGSASQTITLPSGWSNALGGNTTVTNASGPTIVLVYHVVTAGETGLNTFTPTNLWDSSQTNGQIVWALRGGNPANPLDKANSANSNTLTTTHVMAGLTGANAPSLSADIVLGFVTGDGTATYTDPTGWTLDDKSSGGQSQRAGYQNNTTTTAGSDVAATNITSSSSARYASITAAFGVAVPSTAFFTFF